MSFGGADDPVRCCPRRRSYRCGRCLPHVQGGFPGIEELIRRNSQPVPILVQEHGQPRTVAEVLAWVRADAAAAAQGDAWHEAVDAVRDAADYLWPRLPLAERRRFFRHLKPFHDCRRFPVAPQIRQIVQRRLSNDSLKPHAARVVGGATAGTRLRVDLQRCHQVRALRAEFDFVINCIGRNPSPTDSEIAYFRNTVASGSPAIDATGVGLAVNGRSETLRSDGGVNQYILAVGPITKGRFAEVVAVPQITRHPALLTNRLIAENLLRPAFWNRRHWRISIGGTAGRRKVRYCADAMGKRRGYCTIVAISDDGVSPSHPHTLRHQDWQ